MNGLKKNHLHSVLEIPTLRNLKKILKETVVRILIWLKLEWLDSELGYLTENKIAK
jgi:hypothetical protein